LNSFLITEGTVLQLLDLPVYYRVICVDIDLGPIYQIFWLSVSFNWPFFVQLEQQNTKRKNTGIARTSYLEVAKRFPRVQATMSHDHGRLWYKN
jgi:hypothetical protein